MLVVTRFVLEPTSVLDPTGEGLDPTGEGLGPASGGLGPASGQPGEQFLFLAQAEAAMRVLAARPGHVRGRLAQSMDEPNHWCLITEWESVGAYRRALSAMDVKLYATPLLAQAVYEPSAYETLAEITGDGELVTGSSDRHGARINP